MPYDDYDTLAKIKAQMLLHEDVPLYDDGAYLLGGDPNMQQVGLFGKGKPKPVAPSVDLARRSMFGLPQQAPIAENLPAVKSSAMPVPEAVRMPQQSQQPTTQVSQTPLDALVSKAANAPMTRRDVLKKAGQATLNQALPTPKVADVVPEMPTPLSTAQNLAPKFVPNATIDTHLRDFIRSQAQSAYEQEPGAVAATMWSVMRDTLKQKLPKAKFDMYEGLAEDLQYEEDHNVDDSSTADELFTHMQNHIKELPPHELIDVLDYLHMDNYDAYNIHDMLSAHFDSDLPTNPYVEARNARLGIKPTPKPQSMSFKNMVDPHEFDRYIESSVKHAQQKKESK